MEKKFNVNGKEVLVKDFTHLGESISFNLNGKKYHFKLQYHSSHEFVFFGDTKYQSVVSSPLSSGDSIVLINGKEANVSEQTVKFGKSKSHTGGLKSPMPGKIFKVIKPAGSQVLKGETILILEAMKMEHSIRADQDGVVKKINFKEGELVQGGVVLVELE